MGGDAIASYDEDASLEEGFSLLSSGSSAFLRDNLRMKVEDGSLNVENGVVFRATDAEACRSSCTLDQVNEKRKHGVYQEILQTYDSYAGLRTNGMNLEDVKGKILSYHPGAWIDKVGGLKLNDYEVPKTTCLLLIGPRGSGKSSLINKISKLFEDDIFAPVRAQVSYNSHIEDGTYFLQEHMIPRDSASICFFDTRSLSDNNSQDNDRMINHWMTKGVCHGEPVIRDKDNDNFRKSLTYKAYQKGFYSSKIRKVNFVIYVVNGLSVLKEMENVSDVESSYTKTVAYTFKNPLLSFKDDKPVLVVTHGDLLSLSDRAHVRLYLGELLGIPPAKQIFDIPESDGPETKLAIFGMLRYALEHAERNYPQKISIMDKVHKASLPFHVILLILLLVVAILLAYDNSIHPFHALQASAGKVHGWHKMLKFPGKTIKLEWHKIRHIW